MRDWRTVQYDLNGDFFPINFFPCWNIFLVFVILLGDVDIHSDYIFEPRMWYSCAVGVIFPIYICFALKLKVVIWS